MSAYQDWFSLITGFDQGPHDWQRELASSDVAKTRLIRVPTGLGKTEGVLAAWLYHAVAHGRGTWPRRLVWCLPMRVLVEQTAERARELIDRWFEASAREDKPPVHILMGGEDTGRWYLAPTAHMVLVGTQDMLLSRALNRGYASGRARWPVEYGLLNHDCLWVMDEVQLMDVGLATSAQLQAFRDQDQSKHLRRFCCNFGPATSGWTVFDNNWTGSPIMPSDNPFKWRQFEPGLILLCVRWYLRYAVSYRDLEEMMRERGLCVDHTTIYRWVQRYALEIDKRCRPFLRRTTDSYRIDETYVRVGGAWHYLYRGVDSNGDTLDFLLRATRDRNAAIAFFRKTVGASHTTPPRVVNVDKNPAYPIAFEAIKHEGLFRPRSSLRQCKYLNNVIEQDHRFIKRRTRPMLGFKQFTTAWRTVRGIEMMHALRKGQARWMAKGDVVGQTRLIHKVFGLAV